MYVAFAVAADAHPNQDRMATQPQEITSLHILLACPVSSFLHGPRGKHVIKNIQDPGNHLPNQGANLTEDSFLRDAFRGLLLLPLSWLGAEKVTAAAPSRSGEQVSEAAAFAAPPPHFQRAGESLARPLTGVVSADGKGVCRGVTCSKPSKNSRILQTHKGCNLFTFLMPSCVLLTICYCEAC